MSSFTWLLLAGGLSIGFCIGLLVGAFLHTYREASEADAIAPDLSMYDAEAQRRWPARQDEDDHPGDVERQGSMHVPRATAGHSARPYDERYAGMDEGRLLD